MMMNTSHLQAMKGESCVGSARGPLVVECLAGK